MAAQKGRYGSAFREFFTSTCQLNQREPKKARAKKEYSAKSVRGQLGRMFPFVACSALDWPNSLQNAVRSNRHNAPATSASKLNPRHDTASSESGMPPRKRARGLLQARPAKGRFTRPMIMAA
jgi:hypothetical protein